MKEKIYAELEKCGSEIISVMSDLIAFRAVSPHNGGEGESPKAEYLMKKVVELGLPVPKRVDVPDDAAPGGVRPNLIVTIPGKTKKRLWIVSHMDVVPEGERSLWETNPFKAVVKDGRIYGRGASDNNQALVASLFALAACGRAGVVPEYETCLCFVSDEEMGSRFGIRPLVDRGLFSAGDLMVVPDFGSPVGDLLEIAEKNQFWPEITILGKQVHGSTPDKGLNACRVANELSCSLDTVLHKAFPEADSLFDPAGSTFEPTRRRANVENVNTVPGSEQFSFDCRVLPSIPIEKVIDLFQSECDKAAARTGAKISMKYSAHTPSSAATREDDEVVVKLKRAISQVLPAKPKVIGVGGGTCAAFFRAAGIPAVVWEQVEPCAHMPNEFCVLEQLHNEARVFALMMAGV